MALPPCDDKIPTISPVPGRAIIAAIPGRHIVVVTSPRAVYNRSDCRGIAEAVRLAVCMGVVAVVAIRSIFGIDVVGKWSCMA
jgi:hypothetical protein